MNEIRDSEEEIINFCFFFYTYRECDPMRTEGKLRYYEKNKKKPRKRNSQFMLDVCN